MNKKPKEYEYVVFNGETSRSLVEHVGMDKNNREHDLSNDWIRINFEGKHKTYFDQIQNLKVSDGYTDVPTGLRTLSIKKWP